MNPKEAREILGVSRDCSLSELKKRYRIMALRLHPDKNGNTLEATAAFQELNAAYRALSDNEEEKEEEKEETETYSHIFINFIKSLFRKGNQGNQGNQGKDASAAGVTPLLLELLHRIVHDYASVSVNAALDSLDPSVLFQIYEALERYNAAVSMDARIFEDVMRILREKMQQNNIIILKPSLKDLIQNNISVLKYEGHTFYVPLWHSELHYRIETDNPDSPLDRPLDSSSSSRQLIVKCMPDLPAHMTIDANNELHVDVRADIKDLLHSSGEALRIPLYDSECLELPVRDLRLVARQTLHLANNKFGISLICSSDIYEVKNKAPIYVHVHLF
jgi:curved DNA-binding protein CbpA